MTDSAVTKDTNPREILKMFRKTSSEATKEHIAIFMKMPPSDRMELLMYMMVSNFNHINQLNNYTLQRLKHAPIWTEETKTVASTE